MHDKWRNSEPLSVSLSRPHFFPYHFKIVSAVPVAYKLLRTVVVTEWKLKRWGFVFPVNFLDKKLNSVLIWHRTEKLSGDLLIAWTSQRQKNHISNPLILITSDAIPACTMIWVINKIQVHFLTPSETTANSPKWCHCKLHLLWTYSKQFAHLSAEFSLCFPITFGNLWRIRLLRLRTIIFLQNDKQVTMHLCSKSFWPAFVLITNLSFKLSLLCRKSFFFFCLLCSLSGWKIQGFNFISGKKFPLSSFA